MQCFVRGNDLKAIFLRLFCRKEARITHGMLGEEYIETSDGEQYERSAADRNRVSRKD